MSNLNHRCLVLRILAFFKKSLGALTPLCQLLCFTCLFLILRCAPPPSGGTAVELIGAVFKGPVKNATILLRPLASDGTLGKALETIKTTQNGSFTFSTELSQFPLYMQTISGEFSDEATGTLTALSESKTLDCILTEAPTGETINVTPLTTLSARLSLALMEKKEKTKQADTHAKEQIANLFGLMDLMSTLPSDLTDEKPDIPNLDETRYALIIAGLSEQAKQLAQLDPSIDVMALITAMAEDITDGIFDGKRISQGIEEPIDMGTKKIPLPATATTHTLALEIKNFIQNPQNRSGLTETDDMVKNLIDKIENNPVSMIKVTVTPLDASIIVGIGEKRLFHAHTTGLLENKVQWSVNGITGGNPDVGTITQEGEYAAPQTLPSNEEAVTIRATSIAMPKIFGEVKLKLAKVMAITPIKKYAQIGAQSVFEASVSIPETSVEWFVNNIKGGNAIVGTIQEIGNLRATYSAPKNITGPPSVTIKVQSAVNASHMATAELTVFETKATLRYEGFLYDRVSKQELPVSGDGLDAIFKLELDNGSADIADFSDSILTLSLGDLHQVLWDTTADNNIQLLGISEYGGFPLLNNSDGTIDIPAQHKKNYFLYVNDFSEHILAGGNYQLHIGLASGRTLSLSFPLKKTLFVENEISLSGLLPPYSFIGVTPAGHIKATGTDPLELYSEGNMVISGTISNDGSAGENGALNPGNGGKGGTGSSEGGSGGAGIEEKGQGLGGGRNIKSEKNPVGGGGGGYGSPGENGNGTGGGIVYGDEELNPLMGGSGGAGGANDKKESKGGGGGGGGGAIRLQANRDITISGAISANGGNGGNGGFGKRDDDSHTDKQVQASGGGGGSGGGILIHSDVGRIILMGGGQIKAQGGLSGNLGGSGGHGRIRVEGSFIQQGTVDPSPSLPP